MITDKSLEIPIDIQPIIDEIIAAHKEKRIKKISYNNPTFWDIIEENEPESKKIYIQISPRHSD